MDTTRRATEHRKNDLTGFQSRHALAFLAGVLAIYLLPCLPDVAWWLGAAGAVLLSGLLSKRLALLLMMIVLGAAWMSLHAHLRLQAQWPVARHGEDISLSGIIDAMPERHADQWRFTLRSESPAGRIRVTWYRSDADLKAGQCWQLLLRMRSPRGSVNPGGFDYEGWLFAEGIIATAYVRQAQPCSANSERAAWLLKWRQKWVEQVQSVMEGHPMTPALLALTFGVRNGFTQADWDLLRHTGTSHLMAISGLHIGLIATALFFLANVLWRLYPPWLRWLPARRAALIFSSLGALMYALLSGFELPAQRALVMLLVLYWALWRGRLVSPGRTLSVALLAVLILDPMAVARAGFWLSFAAVVWIVFLVSNRWRQTGKLLAFVRLQGFLGLALVPMTFYWFGEASWVAIPVNLVLIPIFACLVPGLFAALVLLPVWPEAASVCLQLAADLLAWIWQGLAWADQGGLLAFRQAAPPVWAMVLALAGIAWFASPRGWPSRGAGLLLCIPLLLPVEQGLRQGELRLTVLDVGQGLSVVVETAAHVLVFDAGPAYDGGFDAGAMVVVPYLRSRGYERLDALVLSHGDLDHRGGMAAVEKAMPVGQRYGFSDGAACRRGMRWQWDAVAFEFLHPDASHWQGNNGSCVLRVAAGRHAVLLTGDIERRAERHLLAGEAGRLGADVLVAPHHGSAGSSSPAFISAVSPEWVIFPAGWRNRWGFPRAEVLRRYRHSRLLSTAQNGAVQLEILPREGVANVVTWRQQNRRLWRASEELGWAAADDD